MFIVIVSLGMVGVGNKSVTEIIFVVIKVINVEHNNIANQRE